MEMVSASASAAFARPPRWAAEAVVYQIFPDRFCRSGRSPQQNGLALAPWGSAPDPHAFQGGDLWGVLDRLDHLQGMGVSCLYLNPIFSSAANHRYHAYDYFQVDPLLGGEPAFAALLACLLYTSPSPRDQRGSRMPSSA